MILESDCSSGETDKPGRISNKQPHPKDQCTYAYIPFYTCSMAHLIKVVCGDARLELCSGDVEDLTSKSTDLSHSILGLGVQKINLGPVETTLARRYARLGPVRTLY